MNWNEVLSELRQGESSSRKFYGTISSPDDIGPAIVGMANTKGGQIFVGIDIKNYHLWGTRIDREWVETLIQSSCHPHFTPEVDFVNKNDKVILIISVEESKDKPHYYKKMCYIMDNDKPRMALLESQDMRSKINSFKHEAELHINELKEDSQFKDEDLQELTSELINLTKKEGKTPPPDIQEQTTLEIPPVEPPNYTFHNKPLKRAEDSSPSPETNVTLNKRQEGALEHLKKEGQIRNKKYRELFEVSHKTAHIELVEMVTNGLIKPEGAGRSTHYILQETS